MFSTTERPLKGKVAIVTGGSRGIGAGIAIELAKRGALVAITYVSSRSGADATLEAMKKHGCDNGLAIQADCAQAESVASEIVAKTIEHFGNTGIDIVVNNAANGSDHSIDMVNRDNFDTMFHTNVLFPMLLVKECARHLNKAARIVNVSSSGARAAMPYSILYAATKAALESATRSLAAQFGKSHGATVNAINPGPVETDMWTQSEGIDALEPSIIERTLAGKRIGRVNDIAPIVAFLCDPSARWITANVTCANGGLTLI